MPAERPVRGAAWRRWSGWTTGPALAGSGWSTSSPWATLGKRRGRGRSGPARAFRRSLPIFRPPTGTSARSRTCWAWSPRAIPIPAGWSCTTTGRRASIRFARTSTPRCPCPGWTAQASLPPPARRGDRRDPGRADPRRSDRARALPLRRGWRGGAAPGDPALLHPPGDGEAGRGEARRPGAPDRGADLRGLLPSPTPWHTARRSSRWRARRFPPGRRRCAPSCWSWSGCTTTWATWGTSAPASGSPSARARAVG